MDSFSVRKEIVMDLDIVYASDIDVGFKVTLPSRYNCVYLPHDPGEGNSCQCV